MIILIKIWPHSTKKGTNNHAEMHSMQKTPWTWIYKDKDWWQEHFDNRIGKEKISLAEEQKSSLFPGKVFRFYGYTPTPPCLWK